jgi:NADPH2 dehydrogenase
MPSLFEPLTIRNLTLRNRVMMAPMIQVSADDQGFASDWHVVHYGARAAGGVGLIMLEATAVASQGRITEADLGLYDDRHIAGLARVAAFCQSQGAKVGVQLAHSGRKAWSRTDGHGPEQAVAPSPLAFDQGWPVPRELSVADINELVERFAQSARRARVAGFDVVEIHGAHGYLVNEFLSPLTNQRGDGYGGSLQNRLRFPLEVVAAVREVWGSRPLFTRVSATDFAEGGIDLPQMLEIARELKAAGVDVIDVSSGGTTPHQPAAWRGYQVPFAEAIKREVGVPTAAVGLITQPETAEEIVRNGRADVVVLGRELLRNPYWPLQAAKALGVDVAWPHQYERAK